MKVAEGAELLAQARAVHAEQWVSIATLTGHASTRDFVGALADLIEVLVPLAIDDPWSHSTEGLDDVCMFCDSFSTVSDHSAPRWVRYDHLTTCPWLVAMDALGREHPHHFASGSALS